jgi:hypothetical protein
VRTRSAIFAAALDQYHECRREYGDYLEAAYQRAETDTNGRLLNRRGMNVGHNAFDLFKGSDTIAYFYASEELVDHWKRYPRMTYAQFERQWFDSRVSETTPPVDDDTPF